MRPRATCASEVRESVSGGHCLPVPDAPQRTRRKCLTAVWFASDTGRDWQQPSTKEAESALARFKRMCRMHKQLPGSLHPPRSYLPDKGSKDQNPDTSLTTPPDTQSCSSHCCVCSDREQKKGRMRELRTAEHHCRLGRKSRSPLCSED